MKPIRKRIPSPMSWVALCAALCHLARRAVGDAAPQDTPGCWNCAHLKTGHLDNKVKWMRCECGHRLIPQEKLIYPHHLFDDPGERVVRVTIDHWTEFNGSGPAMLGQSACEDWAASGRRVVFTPPSLM